MVLAAACIFAAALILYFNIYKSLDYEEEGIRYIIGVSQPDLLSPWQLALNEEIKNEAEKYPDIKVIFSDAGSDEIKQKRDIENMLEQKIDVLIVAPHNGKYLDETISNINKNGIPVIVLEDSSEIEDYTVNIYCDNYKIGREAGKYICELLGEKGGTVLEISGDPDSPVSMERRKGFSEAIKENPAVNLEYVMVGYWSRDKTEERVMEIYKKQPAVDAVFAHNDDMAIGAWRVATYEHINAIFIGVGGIDRKKTGLKAVENGILNATFIYPTGGKEAIENAVKILEGQQVPKIIELPTTRITKDNVSQYNIYSR